MFDKTVINCGLCLHTNKSGYNMTYIDFFDFHVCDECFDDKVGHLLKRTKVVTKYRVSTDFRVGLDRLRNSTEEDFLLRNKILNALLAGKVTIPALRKLILFGIKSMGMCIGGKPRKTSVSNVVGDVISVYMSIVEEYYVQNQYWIISGRLIDLESELAPPSYDELTDIKMLME
jgi:hypothetical protein